MFLLTLLPGGGDPTSLIANQFTSTSDKPCLDEWFSTYPVVFKETFATTTTSPGQSEAESTFQTSGILLITTKSFLQGVAFSILPSECPPHRIGSYLSLQSSSDS